MTEPAVASSDATNIQSSIQKGGSDGYVLNGRKWWISGMCPRVRCRNSCCVYLYTVVLFIKKRLSKLKSLVSRLTVCPHFRGGYVTIKNALGQCGGGGAGLAWRGSTVVYIQ